jgi:hypothetical protein
VVAQYTTGTQSRALHPTLKGSQPLNIRHLPIHHPSHALCSRFAIRERTMGSMRYRLRTLLILLAVGPVLLAGFLLYFERSWNDVVRWWSYEPSPPTPQGSVVPAAAPSSSTLDEE